MPTVTEISQITFQNGGALTTTFTPAPSCATVSSNVVFGLTSRPTQIWYQSDCTFTPYTGCLPFYDTSAVSSFAQQTSLTGNIVYHSPGLYCPSGWTTAGVAQRAGDGALSTSGIFTELSKALSIAEKQDLRFNPDMNLLLGALDKGETAAVCCPSSMTAQWVGNCYSTLPNVPITAGCRVSEPDDAYTEITATFSLVGTTVTAQAFSLTATSSLSRSTTTRTVLPGKPTADGAGIGAAELVAVSRIPMVTLIQRESDRTGAAPGQGKPNAAPQAGRTGSTGAIVLALLVAAWALGIALVLPVF